MKRNHFIRRTHTLKNNNRRRMMFKRAHQRVLQRRRLFISSDMFSQIATKAT